MKKPSIFIIALIFLFVFSCRSNEDPAPMSKGFLTIDLAVNLMITEYSGRISAVNTENFKVSIFTTNHIEVSSYLAGELPASIELPAGGYYVTAHSDNLVPAAFDAPYYYGRSVDFQIQQETTSKVEVKCALANCMLTIDYTDFVKANFSSYSSLVSFSDGSLAFSSGESRTAYFDLTPLTITSTLTFQPISGGSVTKTVVGQISDPQAKTYYKILIDATLNEGEAQFDIIVEEEVNTIELTFGETLQPPIELKTMDDVTYGDLIITEIMFDPSLLTDALGEWVEFYNTSTFRINLNGLRFADNSTSSIYIDEDLIINPGSYFTIAKNIAGLENPSMVSNVLNLANAGERLVLLAPSGLEIAIVDYGLIINAMNTPAGSSLNLSLDKYTANDAQLPVNWCLGTIEYSTGDKGTPGLPNKICQ